MTASFNSWYTVFFPNSVAWFSLYDMRPECGMIIMPDVWEPQRFRQAAIQLIEASELFQKTLASPNASFVSLKVPSFPQALRPLASPQSALESFLPDVFTSQGVATTWRFLAAQQRRVCPASWRMISDDDLAEGRVQLHFIGGLAMQHAVLLHKCTKGETPDMAWLEHWRDKNAASIASKRSGKISKISRKVKPCCTQKRRMFFQGRTADVPWWLVRAYECALGAGGFPVRFHLQKSEPAVVHGFHPLTSALMLCFIHQQLTTIPLAELKLQVQSLCLPVLSGFERPRIPLSKGLMDSCGQSLSFLRRSLNRASIVWPREESDLFLTLEK